MRQKEKQGDIKRQMERARGREQEGGRDGEGE